jgi:transposase
MGRAYSNDLRERVAASVLGGRSCRETAALFGVSVASAVRWSQRLRVSGNAAAKPMGHKPGRRLLAETAFIAARLKADVTLRGVVRELADRGVATSYISVWRVVHEAGLSFKKKPVRQRAGTTRRGAAPGAMESPSGKA